MNSGEKKAFDAERFAGIFGALSDPTRLTILLMLESKPRSVSEIVDYFSLSQPTISRHLAALRQAELVQFEKRGQQKIFRLNGLTLIALIEGFFAGFSELREPGASAAQRKTKP